MNLTEKPKQRFALVFIGTVAVGVFYYLIEWIYGYFNAKKSPILTGYSVSEIDVLKNTISTQKSEIENLEYKLSREIYQIVKVTEDGQTVFYSSIMPSNYNKNRLQIILNNDIVLSNNEGYTFDTTTQRLTLNLPGINLEIDNEVKFCFY